MRICFRCLSLFALLFFAAVSTFGQKVRGFHFIDQTDKKQIDLLYGDALMTSYCYGDSIMKPLLYPLNTVSGITVTRGFPLQPRPNEAVDHPHHIGMWLNYESVNGIDFWNKSTAIPYHLRSKYGSIVHDGVVKTMYAENKALLEVTAHWVNQYGEIFLRETTTYKFSRTETDFIIDRMTRLTAADREVKFNDVKDGFFAIRVAHELQIPSDEPQAMNDQLGRPIIMAATRGDKTVTGSYVSSEGLKDDAVWGTRARWVNLSGRKGGKQVSVTIFDHAKNIGYPAYWHARGYGLFAVNPLGQAIFSEGKEKMNFTLAKNNSVTFRYRVMIHEGESTPVEKLNKLAKRFSASD